jgi:hypothetical protein
MAEEDHSVRGRYRLEGRLGHRTVDYWFRPPDYWRAEQVGEGLIVMAGPEESRKMLVDPLSPPNEVTRLNSPRNLTEDLLSLHLEQREATSEVDPTSQRPAARHMLRDEKGAVAGHLVVDTETQFVLRIECGEEDSLIRLITESFTTIEKPIHRDLFSFIGWDAPSASLCNTLRLGLFWTPVFNR